MRGYPSHRRFAIGVHGHNDRSYAGNKDVRLHGSFPRLLGPTLRRTFRSGNAGKADVHPIAAVVLLGGNARPRRARDRGRRVWSSGAGRQRCVCRARRERQAEATNTGKANHPKGEQ